MVYTSQCGEQLLQSQTFVPIANQSKSQGGCFRTSFAPRTFNWHTIQTHIQVAGRFGRLQWGWSHTRGNWVSGGAGGMSEERAPNRDGSGRRSGKHIRYVYVHISSRKKQQFNKWHHPFFNSFLNSTVVPSPIVNKTKQSFVCIVDFAWEKILLALPQSIILSLMTLRITTADLSFESKPTPIIRTTSFKREV